MCRSIHKHPRRVGNGTCRRLQSTSRHLWPTLGFSSDFASDDVAKCTILGVLSFFWMFFFFYLSGKQILSKCRYLHGCISRADGPISTAACVCYSLTCVAYNLATWVPHSWNKLSCSACVNPHQWKCKWKSSSVAWSASEDHESACENQVA